MPVEKDSGSDSDSGSDTSPAQSSIASDEEGGKEDSPSGFHQSPWADVSINPKSNPSLTKHQYFLLPRRIKGFDLRSKKWRKVFKLFVEALN